MNVSNPDNVSVKDLLNADSSVVGDSQTVIPRDDISKVSSACLEEKSNDIVPSDDVNALENDVNKADVSIAANELLDINTSPTGKLHVTGPPPIPEHVVIHQQKDVSVRKSVASSSSTLPKSSLSNSHEGDKSTNISPNRGKEGHNNAASSNSNSNTNERHNDNNEKSDKGDEFQKDFQETPDKFANAIAPYMKKKVLNHIMLNVFTFRNPVKEDSLCKALMVMDCMSHFYLFRKLISSELQYDIIAFQLSSMFGDFGYPLTVSYNNNGESFYTVDFVSDPNHNVNFESSRM